MNNKKNIAIIWITNNLLMSKNSQKEYFVKRY